MPRYAPRPALSQRSSKGTKTTKLPFLSPNVAVALSPCDQLGDRGADVRRAGLTTHVTGLRAALPQQGFDRVDNRLARRAFPQMLQHQRRRPELFDQIADEFSCNIWCGTMHRLEHRGKLLLRVDVGGRGDADRPGHRGS